MDTVVTLTSVDKWDNIFSLNVLSHSGHWNWRVFWLQQELAFERPHTKVDMGEISYQTLKNKIKSGSDKKKI